MNIFFNFSKKTRICGALLLSATAIYAEVSMAEGKTIRTVNGSTSAQLLPSAESNASGQLRAEQWDVARSGEMVLSLPVLNQMVREWLAEKNRIIEIQYPGGEAGEFWVQELTDWLVSLGIPSKYIVTIPGSGADDVIKFKLRVLRKTSL